MAGFQSLYPVLLISAIALHFTIIVHGNIENNMYINWGNQHASMLGDDLQLVLDQTSGKYQTKYTYTFIHSFINTVINM